ncbi:MULTISPECIES: pyridoxamine 5'-phosphate oxidase family protein [unclassified Clostridium]|uniref:pyridoxamine 5'-phosphate oxidase family protein n=1 Tax=unclassified Clostridium TaxID=2614128 RepID=UPI00189806E1|nr:MULTISPECIES: pyridoxamine 5'-phosphate oxidase family protein [unclassified Clostridium]MCR1950568.1 pyridoxamine 5'-phosphate oxidase family protein [Clostridium sp. DSM 100503]
MKKKLIALLLCGGMTLSMIACSEQKENETVTASVDTISKASTEVYYGESSWDEAKVKEVLKNNVSKAAAVVVSTTNEDGTPNAATIVPGLVNDNTLLFNIATEGNTKKNMLERQIAVLSLFAHNPEAEDKALRNQGARVILKTITDEDKINELVKEAQLKDASTAVFMEIVEILPLG